MLPFCLNSRHRRFHMEIASMNSSVNFIGLPAVKRGVIDILLPGHRMPEQKTQLGRSDCLPGSAVEFIVTEVSQFHLALLDGAHHTDDVGEHLIRGIRLQGIILAPMGTS